MNAATLKDHWLRVLVAAAEAVEAAALAHALTVADCTAERRVIRADREWLNHFDWGRA